MADTTSSSIQSGRKDDSGKPRWDLLPWREVEQVVGVMTFGAGKYSDNGWQQVVAGPGWRARYFSACHRHIAAWWSGEYRDGETGHSHLAHAICCLLILLWSERGGADE